MSDEAVASLASNLGEDETVADFLGRPSGAQRQFIEKLRASGAIDRRNESQYLRPNGTLNEDGRTYVTRLFVGKMVPDPHLLGEIPASLMTSLAKAAPYILAAKAHGSKYDVTGDLRGALHAIVDMDMHGSKNIDEHLRQQDMFAAPLEVATNKGARRILEVLTRNKGPNQMSAVFRDFAAKAKGAPEGQSDMFGGGDGAMSVLDRAAMKKGQTIYYGPEGGKYTDPEHKHSWSPDEKGGMQSDWVGGESDEKRKVRNERVAAAVKAWQVAAKANHADPSSGKAYRAHEAALHALGKALNLGTGKDAVEGAQRWLRSRGHRPDIKQPRSAQAPARQLAFA
jgi:hypothetical protein